MGKEFISINGNIKERLIRLTGNVEILENYLKDEKNRKKLSSNEIEHLEFRIETMKELNKIGEENKKALIGNKRKSLIAPIEREDGTVELAHIHQDKVQNTFNGCWSVSLQLLLQSRGIKLTQEQIRSFRHNFVSEEEVEVIPESDEKDINQDRKNEMVNKVDLVMKVLPNTSVNNMLFMRGESMKNMDHAIETFKTVVKTALIEDCSPLSMVANGHFRTIVGIQGDEVLVKDSIQFRTHGANHTYKVPIKDIVKNTTKLFWLHDLQMEKDGSCAEFSEVKGLSYKDGVMATENVKRDNSGELFAVENFQDFCTRDAKGFGVDTHKFEDIDKKPGRYMMNLPAKIYEGVPRKVRRYTEAEIGLIDKLKEREVLEDIQMILNTPDENGLYPAMTEKQLEDLNAAYEKVSNIYQEILNDKNVSLSAKQRNHLEVLKGRVDRERQIFSNLQKNENGVLPTYRDALRQGKRELEAGGKNPYEAKAQALKTLLTKFTQMEKSGHKNSKEYTAMVTTASNLQMVVDAIADPKKWENFGLKGIPDENKVDELLKRAEEVAVKAVEKYVNEKANPYTEFGKHRYAAAKELQEELSKSLNIFREERVEALVKEQARLKAEISAPKQELPEEKAPEQKQEEGPVLK
jgi:uncharacterized protein Yka (UPF0111/DUF47 family)